MIGQTVLRDFRITKKIGAGAFATVYLAQQRHMDRQVVVKITHPHLVEGDLSKMIESRYQAEIKAAARVQHPNLVTIHTAGYIQEIPAVVMEYVAGRTLNSWLMEEAPLNPALSLSLFQQIGSAIKALHDEGVVHRDINPRNIMISPKPNGTFRAVLLDFGVAQLDGSTKHTMGPLGTPRYMAPEQAQGNSTTASDVYSLGVMLWWAFTGQRYLQQYDNFAEIFRHQLEHPVVASPKSVNPSVPIPLATIITKMLSPKASKRPSIGQFVEFWEAYLQDQPSTYAMFPTQQQDEVLRGQMLEEYSQVAEELSEVSSQSNDGIHIFDPAGEGVLLKTTQRILAERFPCTPLESLWDLNESEPSAQPLLLCIQDPQVGLMTLGMIAEMNIRNEVIVITPDVSWANAWAEHVHHTVFRLPTQTTSMIHHLQSLLDLRGKEEKTVSMASVSLLNTREESFDGTMLTSRNGIKPLETQAMINTFIGQMPQLLSQMEESLTNSRVIIPCCETIESLAHPLGMNRVVRLSKMIKGFASNDLMDAIAGPYQELEDAYTESFRELVRLRF